MLKAYSIEFIPLYQCFSTFFRSRIIWKIVERLAETSYSKVKIVLIWGFSRNPAINEGNIWVLRNPGWKKRLYIKNGQWLVPQRIISIIESAIAVRTAGGGWGRNFPHFLLHLSSHLMVHFRIVHIECSKLPRFGHQMAGQMLQTAVDLQPHDIDIYNFLY